MYDVIVVRYGEIALKGQNRSYFVNKLIDNIKNGCKNITDFKIKKTSGRIFIFPHNNFKKMLDRLKKIPGIVSISPALEVELEYEELEKKGLKLFENEISDADFPVTFRVTTNRANKSFPYTSLQVSKKIGASILKKFGDQKLSVDLENPDYNLNYDIRKNKTYIFVKTIKGPGGLPVGCSGRGLLLLSGGIDSPVAGWQGMKRGIKVDALHFHSFPYTSERAKEKVFKLTKILSQTQVEIQLHICRFTEIQRAIKQKCDKQFIITIMRRMMIRIANKIAEQNNNQILITGENIGQVSSQTLENISVINKVSKIPIIRPLVTMDKEEIINIAKNIGTYKTSIQPYEDCCTIFVPDHPVTKPTIEMAVENEKKLDIENLVQEAVENTELTTIKE